MERHTFTIPIGDWSGDGHGQQRDFYATSAKPIEAVREAYFAAKAKLPKLCPEMFCNEYEDSKLDRSVADALRAAGCPLPDLDADPGDEERLEGMDAEAMANVVAWFLNQGNPDIDVRIEPAERVPMLAFYGHDTQGRHIGFFGYGLLGR